MMLETLTTEALLALATVGVSLLAIAGVGMALRGVQRQPEQINVDDAVRNAPYHRLHNIVSVEKP